MNDQPGAASDHAIVVGAGVIGSAIALELQRGGYQVTVVDQGEAVGGGSTSASSSIIRFTYSTLDGVAASWEAMHMWASWADHLGEVDGPLCRFHRVGMLHLPGPDDDLGPMCDHFDQVGVGYEMLGPEEITARFPAVDVGRFHPPRSLDDEQFFDPPQGVVSGLFMPDAGFVDDPQLAATNLMTAAQRHGAALRLRSEVVAVLRNGQQVTGVRLVGGEELPARVVVNAAGPWSNRLNGLAGVADDMAISGRPMRQTVTAAPAPPTFGVGSGGTVVADVDLGSYFRPQPGGALVMGGVEAPCDPLEWVDDPAEFGFLPDPQVGEVVTLRVARRIPDLGVPLGPTGLAHFYDVTPDWTPVYDRTVLDGFFVAVGTSGNQFKNAPLVGVMMKELIDACRAGHDHDREPVVVIGPHTGLPIGLGQFSRHRDLASTSGTVMG